MIEIERFFDFQNFRQKSLWEKASSLWEPLQNLPSYLTKLSLTPIDPRFYPEVTLENPSTIFLEEGVILEKGAYIKGPCYLGEGCIIRHAAYLRGNILLGRKCIIGHASEIKNTIMMDFSCAAHLNYVGDSILGEAVNLGAGVICANLRFDKKPIQVTLPEGAKVSTNQKKLGAIVGDAAQIGCNSVLNPGSFLEKGAHVFPLTSVQGYVRSYSLIR